MATNLKVEKKEEPRAPRTVYFKIVEGWLVIDPPCDTAKRRIKLSSVSWYQANRFEVVVSGVGYEIRMRAEGELSDAETDEERRNIVARFLGLLDLAYSLKADEPTQDHA